MKALQGVPGVAFITAMYLYTEIMDMKRFANDNHLVSFVGLVPSTQTSDENVYSNGISFRQNSFLRTMMIEAAWTAVREDPAMTLKFKELTKRMNISECHYSHRKETRQKNSPRLAQAGRICLCTCRIKQQPKADPPMAEKNCYNKNGADCLLKLVCAGTRSPNSLS